MKIGSKSSITPSDIELEDIKLQNLFSKKIIRTSFKQQTFFKFNYMYFVETPGILLSRWDHCHSSLFPILEHMIAERETLNEFI